MAKTADVDKKIIAENPGVSPRELLINFGLSEQGFNALVATNEAGRQSAATATKKVLTPQVLDILQPKLSNDILSPATGLSDKVRLVPAEGGLGMDVSRVQATKMLRKYPTKYKIL